MRFQVPQFIDVEDKIFGPLTLKQFIYLAGSGGFAVIMLTILPRFLAIFISAPVVGLGLALAFYRVHNRPFIFVLEAAFNYITRNRLYLWQKTDKPVRPAEPSTAPKGIVLPPLSEGRLKNLALGLETRTELNGREDEKADKHAL